MKGIKGVKQKGAMTLEAALVLPVLLCAFFSVVFIIKAVYTYELIQHALDQTASEIASAGYIYHVSGIRDIHDTIRNDSNDNSKLFREQMDSVFDAYHSLKNIKSTSEPSEQGLQGARNSAESLSNAEQNFANILEDAENIISNPLDELKSIACYIASGSFDNAKTQLFTPIVKHCMKKYLVSEGVSDAEKRLITLNVSDGFSGMDFSESSFLADREENIDIVVRYRIRLPLPIQFNSAFEFVQRVKVKAWMGGDEPQDVLENSDSTDVTDDLWSLSNFARGQKIRKLFGANLPANFPVIAKYDNGAAVMIKSMDLTAPSYQEGVNAQKILKRYMDELASYKGQEKPWGSGDIVIRKDEIISRELLLVIPTNTLSEANEKLISDMMMSAPLQGITLVVKRYGTKIFDSDEG